MGFFLYVPSARLDLGEFALLRELEEKLVGAHHHENGEGRRLIV